ncbi:class I SAM-dependent methyltransferase [Massilia glaciei]|uniref:Class I SAM-dependent methyltransferase n=1 Tax=Massilia glaciei TaxID=1524097 RepID=A0A2U2HJP4_9BURK|nr:class I SAM-dependent methyltransferase [Massilia glaciei]PWF47655.1 class I SAM-dependent methyltransferase [Massilia glaciei]
MNREPAGSEPGWNTGGHADFYDRCEAQSAGVAALERFAAIQAAVMRALGAPTRPLNVADIGCGAGTQSRLWASAGHRVAGADINAALITLARRRALEAGQEIRFELASATALPWPERSMDLCLAPGLLEHVDDWRACLAEMARVLRPGGALYLSTNNKLCPLQDAFALPLYAWYPGWLKRRCVRLARTTRPSLAGHATYPALNWFTYYGLRADLARHGMDSLDRFDMIDPRRLRRFQRPAFALLRALPPLRFCAHVLTPCTALLAFKRPA